MRLLFLVSAHGFGHASRSAALLRALRERAGPELAVHVRSEAPARFFQRADPAAEVTAARVDVALVQPNGLDVDRPASLEAHLRFLAEMDALAAREAEFARAWGADLVLADVPPLACEAAARAGLPAVPVSNFSWDWILADFAEADARWRPVVERFAEAYSRTHRVLRLPWGGGFESAPRVEDAPLLVPRGGAGPEAARAALGLAPDEPRAVALVTFGGFGASDVRAVGEDLSDWLFVGYGDPPPGLRAEWVPLPTHAAVPHPDLVALADVVLGKTAYGTAAEAVAAGTPFLFLVRPGFRESPVLRDALLALEAGRVLPREDFEAGRWRAHLEAARALRPRRGAVATDGDRRIAERVLGLFGAGR